MCPFYIQQVRTDCFIALFRIRQNLKECHDRRKRILRNMFHTQCTPLSETKSVHLIRHLLIGNEAHSLSLLSWRSRIVILMHDVQPRAVTDVVYRRLKLIFSNCWFFSTVLTWRKTQVLFTMRRLFPQGLL
jgi:hypothetical protein